MVCWCHGLSLANHATDAFEVPNRVPYGWRRLGRDTQYALQSRFHMMFIGFQWISMDFLKDFLRILEAFEDSRVLRRSATSWKTWPMPWSSRSFNARGWSLEHRGPWPPCARMWEALKRHSLSNPLEIPSKSLRNPIEIPLRSSKN